jgi:hypothetical protein
MKEQAKQLKDMKYQRPDISVFVTDLKCSLLAGTVTSNSEGDDGMSDRGSDPVIIGGGGAKGNSFFWDEGDDSNSDPNAIGR